MTVLGGFHHVRLSISTAHDSLERRRCRRLLGLEVARGRPVGGIAGTDGIEIRLRTRQRRP